MKDWKSTVIIDAPVSEVFAFTTNPEKTHLWIEGIQKEESSEFPPVLGTTYRNTSDGKDWDEYEVVELQENEVFTLAKKSSPYRVRYSYRKTDSAQTELTYYEWVEEGELENPFSEECLEVLKELLSR